MISPEIAPDWATPYSVAASTVKKRQKLTSADSGVWAIQGFWKGAYRVHAQWYEFGGEHEESPGGGEQSDGKGGRLGATRTIWKRGPYAASAGIQASLLTESYRDERAHSQILGFPVLLGVRRSEASETYRWIAIAGHAYTGGKLVVGMENLWMGNPRVRATQAIYAFQGPILGVGASLASLWMSFEVSPVFALLPVANASFSLALPAFGINIEFEPEEKPLSDENRPGDEPRSEGR